MKKTTILALFLFLNACASIPYPKPISKTDTLSQTCKTEIEELRAIDLSKPSPTDGFVKNQLCIAQKACENREKFDDAIWLDNVLHDFVEAYIQKTNDWNKVIKKCETRQIVEPFGGLFCQKDMAQYHIFTDLSHSVFAEGCGTYKDWKLLENAIRYCVKEAHYPPIISQFVKNRVITYRDQVRNQCLKAK